MIFGQAARFWGTANVTPKRTESRGLGVEDPQELSSLFLSGFHAARVHVQIDRCPFFMRLSACGGAAEAVPFFSCGEHERFYGPLTDMDKMRFYFHI